MAKAGADRNKKNKKTDDNPKKGMDERSKGDFLLDKGIDESDSSNGAKRDEKNVGESVEAELIRFKITGHDGIGQQLGELTTPDFHPSPKKPIIRNQMGVV